MLWRKKKNSNNQTCSFPSARAALRCYSVELCFHLGLQRFSVCEVKSSRCAQPAWTSLVSWPVTATISQHLPIKASHFLPSRPRDSLTGRAMTAPRLLIGHFSFSKIPEWLTSSFGMSQYDFSYSTRGRFRERPHLCSFDLYVFFFFHFCCCFFPTDPKTLNCSLVSFSGKELGNAPRSELLCQHVCAWVLTYCGTDRRKSFVSRALSSRLHMSKILKSFFFLGTQELVFTLALLVILSELEFVQDKWRQDLDLNLRCVNGTVVFAQLQTLPTRALLCEKVQ